MATAVHRPVSFDDARQLSIPLAPTAEPCTTQPMGSPTAVKTDEPTTSNNATAKAAKGTPAAAIPSIQGPSVWTPATWEGRTHEFIYTLTPEDIQELRTAVNTFINASTAIPGGLSQALVHMDLTAFPLPTLGPKMRTLANQQLRGTHGRGFQLLRGMPVDQFGQQGALVAYMGLAASMGYANSPQRKDGKMVHHIKALNSATGAGSRYAESTMSAAMGFHTDAQGDVLGLLCLRQAPEGGESRWVSAGAIHNEMLKRPGGRQLVSMMSSRGLWFRNKDRYQVIPEGEEPWWDMPVFDYTDDSFACHYAPTNHYTEAFRMYGAAGLGSMSEQQMAAIQMFESIAESPEFTMKLTMLNGDMMFLNNTLVLHARSSFKDGDTPELRRHLVRLWMLDADIAQQQQQQQEVPATGSSSITGITGISKGITHRLPRHLDYPRDYSPAGGYSLETCRPGLMRPDPATFFVPLDAEDPRN